MKHKTNLNIHTLAVAFGLFFLNSYSQEFPNIKYLDEETIDEVKIDYDKDGDVDLIIAGVYVKKNQGRVYLIENNGSKYNKPEHIFSFPSIGFKQEIEILQDENMTTINVIGTSPTGKKEKFTATLFKGEFEGLTIPPITSVSKN